MQHSKKPKLTTNFPWSFYLQFWILYSYHKLKQFSEPLVLWWLQSINLIIKQWWFNIEYDSKTFKARLSSCHKKVQKNLNESEILKIFSNFLELLQKYIQTHSILLKFSKRFLSDFESFKSLKFSFAVNYPLMFLKHFSVLKLPLSKKHISIPPFFIKSLSHKWTKAQQNSS